MKIYSVEGIQIKFKSYSSLPLSIGYTRFTQSESVHKTSSLNRTMNLLLFSINIFQK